ncbi:MAG TPA: helix-turn-helix domain-containing protein [Pseudonocardia sp.]|uniref:TetR/AcrR family transcriptional regulator n=1 Tax=Pseudonocardia sp. TaxID=60912 RepID=UPI002B4ABE15|nr:helix-turn-helix domain-containing protein [Pseudonocardia sp.]HLU58194.1 helix-turn-helix domain-containing protein [Pseudonocardia sp.]
MPSGWPVEVHEVVEVEMGADRPPARSERADARRNRERLLSAAEEIFLAEGAEAPLDAVAKRAGVGIATLYRHFPTRQDLLEALLADTYDRLGAQARDMLSAESPGQALLDWLRAFISQVTAFHGMASSALATLETARLSDSCHRMRLSGETLFLRAQAVGEAPADLAFIDVLRLVGAIAVAAERDPATADRLLAVAARGFLSPGDDAGRPRSSPRGSRSGERRRG